MSKIRRFRPAISMSWRRWWGPLVPSWIFTYNNRNKLPRKCHTKKLNIAAILQAIPSHLIIQISKDKSSRRQRLLLRRRFLFNNNCNFNNNKNYWLRHRPNRPKISFNNCLQSSLGSTLVRQIRILVGALCRFRCSSNSYNSSNSSSSTSSNKTCKTTYFSRTMYWNIYNKMSLDKVGKFRIITNIRYRNRCNNSNNYAQASKWTLKRTESWYKEWVGTGPLNSKDGSFRNSMFNFWRIKR